MDDLDVLARDLGYRNQGKSAPMRSSGAPTASASPIIDDFDDVFGGPPKYTATSNSNSNDFDYDSIFKSTASSSRNSTTAVTDGPVYDKPVYDDDIFEGLPGMKSKSVSSSKGMKLDQFDDLLGNFGRKENDRSSSMQGMDDLLGSLGRNDKAKSSGGSSGTRDFDDLLGGFGSGNRPTNASPHQLKQTSPLDDPFVVLDSTSPVSSSSGVFIDPLKDVSQLGKSGDSKGDTSSMSGGAFDDIDPLNGFNKSVPPYSPDKDGREKAESPSKSMGRKHRDTSSFRYPESHSQKKVPVENLHESPLFDIPSVSTDPKKYVSSPPRYSGVSHDENFQADVSPRTEQLPNSSGDIWLSVSEVPLFTQPTKAPPPSRPPPPIPRRTSMASGRKKGNDYSPNYSSYSGSPKLRHPEDNKSSESQIDDLEDFAMGRSQNNIHSAEDTDTAVAAMKEAMDKAEAKFRHAKEVREREHAKAAKSKENFQAEKDERTMQEARERLGNERRHKEKEEEMEKRRLEKERTERERARQAVERATREARERAAAEARERAAAEARLRAERAAVGKAQAEARDRAGKAAVQRVQAEARERAAAEAKERAEKAAAEAREKSTTEAKEKAEALRRSQRAAVDRAAAEARERAATDARVRAANAARASQQKNENDLESFFSSSRPSSVPKARTSSLDPFFDQFQNKGGSDSAKRTTSTGGPTSNIKKTSSATNIVDDLSSIFGAPSSSGNFQDIEGETEERRRARLERHQRTQERAAKALDEKNQRDMQVQRDQEERNRIGETLDFEIKRWSAGKEGNLRALLSTLQYVLWPQCGWQPVSLTDLITGASVKKAYRKATLCIHPDKVQQKGATLQQKYIAEKVFDLLKEAWNKFNSEELF